jgi:hypothetical protein
MVGQAVPAPLFFCLLPLTSKKGAGDFLCRSFPKNVGLVAGHSVHYKVVGDFEMEVSTGLPPVTQKKHQERLSNSIQLRGKANRLKVEL